LPWIPFVWLGPECRKVPLAWFQAIPRVRRVFEILPIPRPAAGNESGRHEVPPFEIAASPPAVSKGFVSVAALQEGAQGFAVAAFSNTGANVSGPGVGIISAKVGGGLVSMDGTSMATPHVAGVAALWAQKLKQDGRFTADQFSAELLASATRLPLNASSTLETVGAGVVSAPQL
jgi:subtilisin family serine protease